MKLKKAFVILILGVVVSVCFVGCVEKPPSEPTVTPTPTTTIINFGESIIVDTQCQDPLSSQSCPVKITPVSSRYTTKKLDYYGREAYEGKIYFEVLFEGENMGNYKSSFISISDVMVKTNKGYFYDSFTHLDFGLYIEPGEKDYYYIASRIPENQSVVEMNFSITDGKGVGGTVYAKRTLIFEQPTPTI